jgi:serine/threonine protein kinase
MEYVEGLSLQQKVIQGPLDSDSVADIAVQVAAGLEAAHQKGIIHRDIKSANIMLTEEGQAKIMDFGLAKVAGESQLTKEARTIGTIAYMSPEQAQGEDLDNRTDIWSFGVVLYEMLTGRMPFRGGQESIILHSIVGAEPKPLRQLKPDIPVELQKIIERALKKRREDRYASASEMADELRSYLETSRAEKAGFFNLKSLARRLKRPAYFVPAAAVLIALGFSVRYFVRHNARVRWAKLTAIPKSRSSLKRKSTPTLSPWRGRLNVSSPRTPFSRNSGRKCRQRSASRRTLPGRISFIRAIKNTTKTGQDSESHPSAEPGFPMAFSAGGPTKLAMRLSIGLRSLRLTPKS